MVTEALDPVVTCLVKVQTGLSLGVVVFSRAQQDEIEGALAALAREDEAFGDQLEAEYVREEDDHFCGLFVKNLENVQGDERDVIMISICHGPDGNGRMLMNFGPIDKAGGERRLNVVFSRARRHMVVVSSVRYTAITKRVQRRGELPPPLRRVRRGPVDRHAAAGRVLDACCPGRARGAGAAAVVQDPVGRVLAAGLRARGFEVAADVGASHLRCDLAMRRACCGASRPRSGAEAQLFRWHMLQKFPESSRNSASVP